MNKKEIFFFLFMVENLEMLILRFVEKIFLSVVIFRKLRRRLLVV